MALKTNVVDGQMSPAMYIIIGSLFEVQKYMTLNVTIALITLPVGVV